MRKELMTNLNEALSNNRELMESNRQLMQTNARLQEKVRDLESKRNTDYGSMVTSPGRYVAEDLMKLRSNKMEGAIEEIKHEEDHREKNVWSLQSKR